LEPVSNQPALARSAYRSAFSMRMIINDSGLLTAQSFTLTAYGWGSP